MSEHKITVPGGESVRLLTAGKYCDRDIVVTAEGGTAPEDLDAVLTEQEALIDELQDALRGKGSAWYDAFWDAYQENGNRKSYAGAFSGNGWNEKTFFPKYPVKPTGITTAERMFSYFNQFSSNADLNGLFDFTPFNDMFDFSAVKRLENTFANARIKNVFVDASSAAILTSTFACGNGGSVDGITLRVTKTCTNFGGIFGYLKAIEKLHFTDDSEIAATIAIPGTATQLSKDSIISIVNALSTTATGKTVTLSKTAVNNAFATTEGGTDGSTSEEWLALVGTKPNWTFVYA